MNTEQASEYLADPHDSIHISLISLEPGTHVGILYFVKEVVRYGRVTFGYHLSVYTES